MKYDSKMQAFGAGDIPMSEDNFNALKEANRTMLQVPIEAEDAHSCRPTSAREDTYSAVFTRIEFRGIHCIRLRCIHAVL